VGKRLSAEVLAHRNRDELLQAYVAEQKGTEDIGREFGCSGFTIAQWLKEFGIPIRKNGDILHPRNDKEWLWNAHVNEGKTTVAIAKEAGVSACTVRIWMKQLGIPIKTLEDKMLERVGTYWQDEAWLRAAYIRNGRNTKALCREIGVDHRSVEKYLDLYGIPRRTLEEFFDLSSSDLTFWDEWSPNMAFVLGYAFADGCVSPRSLTMVSVDRDLLEKIAECVRFTGNIVGYSQTGISTLVKSTKVKPQHALILSDRRLPEKLAKYNLVPRKTLIAEMPTNIPSDCIGPFVRGLFDGDGCARLQAHGKNKTKTLHLITVSASPKLIYPLQDAIASACGAKGKVVVVKRPSYNAMYHLEYINSNDVLRVADLMYKGSQGLYLQRKRDKVGEFVRYAASGYGDNNRWPRYDRDTQELILKTATEWPHIDSPRALVAA
jgi:hypothetical protein